MSVFSGKQFPGAMRAHREKRKNDAQNRQEVFDVEYNEAGGPEVHTRRDFGQIRYVRRLTRADQ